MTQLDLLATEPAQDTQCKTLLDAFRRGETHTVSSALHQFGIYALSQRCGELRKMGWNIQGVMIALPNQKRIAQYRLV